MSIKFAVVNGSSSTTVLCEVEQGKTELLRLVLEAVEKDNFSQVVTLIAVVSGPWVFATAVAWWWRWKVSRLYERMCADKDKEIERQAKRIKELENHLLKTKR